GLRADRGRRRAAPRATRRVGRRIPARLRLRPRERIPAIRAAPRSDRRHALGARGAAAAAIRARRRIVASVSTRDATLQPDAIATLADLPRVRARTHGNNIAIVFHDRSLTFAELDAESDRAARAFAAAGVGAGERIA